MSPSTSARDVKSPPTAPHQPHQPEVRLHVEGDKYVSPAEVHAQLLQPAGVGGALAVIAVSSNESRVACRTWSEAYKLLSYCTADVQRRLGLRCRPACIDGVPLTRTQMARLAQADAPAQPHVLRADSPRAGEWRAEERKASSPRRSRATGVPPAQ